MFNQFKDFRYQNFKQLKNDCAKADNLFNDGLFGADHLCLDINGGMQNREVQWLRPRVSLYFLGRVGKVALLIGVLELSFKPFIGLRNKSGTEKSGTKCKLCTVAKIGINLLNL